MKYQFMEQQRRYHRVEKMARVLLVLAKPDATHDICDRILALLGKRDE